jgi:hypothetical protein
MCNITITPKSNTVNSLNYNFLNVILTILKQ